MRQEHFHENIPEGCPPSDSVIDTPVLVFRTCKRTELHSKDFQSYYELDIAVSEDNVCNSFGLSCVTDYEYALNKALQSPRRWKAIAKAEILPEHGRIKQTGQPPHHTWWPYSGVERAEIFEIVWKTGQG